MASLKDFLLLAILLYLINSKVSSSKKKILSDISSNKSQLFTSKTFKNFLFYISGVYLLWIYTIDRYASYFSNRKSLFFQSLFYYPVQYLKKRYFPAVLQRDFSEPLVSKLYFNTDPNSKYIIGFHPHGIWSISTPLHFMLSNGFPELDYRIVTISLNFSIPIIRDILLLLGVADASRNTINHLLNRNTSVGIVLGGAEESLHNTRGSNDLTLASRIGFCQIALEQGADLIPVYTFGENDLYNKYTPLNDTFIQRFKRIFKFVPILFGGLFYGLLPLPKKLPIHTVVGRPINVKQVKNPSLNDILDLHEIYCQKLIELFHSYKHLYPQRKSDIEIVDTLKMKHLYKWKKIESKRKSKL